MNVVLQTVGKVWELSGKRILLYLVVCLVTLLSVTSSTALDPLTPFNISDGAGRVRSDLEIEVVDGLGGPVEEIVVTVDGGPRNVTFERDGDVSRGVIPIEVFGSFTKVEVGLEVRADDQIFMFGPIAFTTDYFYDEVIKPGTRWIEVEDFNFTNENGSGQWIPGANGGPDGEPYDVGAYAGLGATVGVDYSGDQNNSGIPPQQDAIWYRYEGLESNGTNLSPEITTNVGGDNARRGSFTLENNYKLGWVSDGDWYTFTRDFNAGLYEVYARPQGDGTGSSTGRVEWVDDPTSATPKLTLIGEYTGQVSGSWGTGAFYHVGQAFIPKAGEYSLRWTKLQGNHDMDYLAFVPADQGALSPLLGIDQAGGQVLLHWFKDYLEHSPRPEGPYARVADAVSPYDATDRPGFYRIR